MVMILMTGRFLKVIVVSVFMWFFLSTTSAIASPIDPSLASLQQREGDVTLRNFGFQDGEHLALLKLHYTALGTPQRNAAGKIINAVLLLRTTTGTGKSFLMPTLVNVLFQPGQPLDARRFYIVLPDGIGFGGSTKPSDGLFGHFPHYGYVDQVVAQHTLVELLGIDHLKLVLGISQGGMQAWLWAERFPDAMDGVVPIACYPMQISGRNLMWRQVVINAVRDDPKWHGGNYSPADPPTAWKDVAGLMFPMMVGTAERLQAAGPDRERSLRTTRT